MRYLEAIEGDDYRRLPGGIFNKSFVKAYARYIGFSETEAVEEYLRTAREQGSSDEVATTPHQSHVYTDGNSARSPFITLLLTVLILAILSLGVYAGLHWYQRRAANPAAGNSSPAPAHNSGNTNAGAATSRPQQASQPAAALNVQIKARGEKVWIRTRQDDEKRTEATLAAEETREFKPAQSLTIEYSKDKVSALEVNINGRAARVPTEPKPKTILTEMVITKDNYEQYLP